MLKKDRLYITNMAIVNKSISIRGVQKKSLFTFYNNKSSAYLLKIRLMIDINCC